VIMSRQDKICKVVFAGFCLFAARDVHSLPAIFTVASRAMPHWAKAALNPQTTHQTSKAVVERGRDEKL
jgi:hypothetical protein